MYKDGRKKTKRKPGDLVFSINKTFHMNNIDISNIICSVVK